MISSKMSIEKQKCLIESCLQQGTNVTSTLNQIGLTYDDLRYEFNHLLQIPKTTLQFLDDVTRQPNQIPAISFFAGAGGFDVGFYCAGYDNLASIEINPTFCETLRHNFPKKLVIGPPDYSGDVRKREEIAEILHHKLNIGSPFEGVFHGGPPCQPFSIAANQRFSKNGNNFKRVGFEHDEYGNLLFDYLWFIKTFQPRVFVIENVAGFMDMDKGAQVQRAIAMMKESGYEVSEPQIFNLADFGVPQQRLRFVIVGNRLQRSFRFPERQQNKVPCLRALEKSLEGVANHETREHKPESLLRYIKLDYGKRDKLGRVDRLNPAKPAKTVIAGGTKGGGRSHLHPIIPRTLSVRECARLQTFPDWYTFTGATARQFTQVGNAVPPLFAFKLANAIKAQFFDEEQKAHELTLVHANLSLFDC